MGLQNPLPSIQRGQTELSLKAEIEEKKSMRQFTGRKKKIRPSESQALTLRSAEELPPDLKGWVYTDMRSF